MTQGRITLLLVEDEVPHCELIRRAFQSRSPEIRIWNADGVSAARKYLDRQQPDLLLADYDLRDGRGTELLPGPGKRLPYPIIIMTGQGDERVAVQAMKDGAHDYVVKSAESLKDMPHIVGRALREWRQLRKHEQAERALRESESRFRELMASAHVLCWEMDPSNMQFTLIVGNTQELLGYPLEDWYAPEFYRTHVHPDDRRWVLPFLEQRAGDADQFAFNHRMLAFDGRTVWLHNSVQVVHPPSGRMMLRGFLLDVTEKALAEKERLELRERLQQSQKLESLGILAGGLAHDFNNLLTGILAYTELALLDLPAGSPVSRHVIEIQHAAEHAGDLCRQMLAYSGGVEFVFKTFGLSELVSEMLRLLEIAIPKTITLHCELAADLPDMQGDVNQIRQVVMNLIKNGAEAIGPQGGTITIRTSLVRADAKLLDALYVEEDLPEGNYISLEVCDTGCGMNEEMLSRLFDPFFTTKSTGRGLGLASVLGFVRAHGGGIRVSSKPGTGTQFMFLFAPSGSAALGG